MLACPNEHKLIQKTSWTKSYMIPAISEEGIQRLFENAAHEKTNPKIKLPQSPTTSKNTVQSCEIEEMWLTILEN